MRYLSTPLAAAAFLVVLLSAFGASAGAQELSTVDPDAKVPSIAWPSEHFDLVFSEPSSVLDIYRAWSQASGLEVTFDPGIKDLRLKIELHDMTAQRALSTLTKSVGHFFVALDEKTLLIAEDTPQNRRNYEPQAVRTFLLDNLGVGDALTLVRSLVGAKNATAVEQNNSLILRDTVATVGVVADLLAAVDVPPPAIALDVELLYLDSRRREKQAVKLNGNSSGLPTRLSAAELSRLRQQARTLAAPRLEMLDGRSAHVDLEDTFALTDASGAVDQLALGLELKVEAQVHARSGEVGLQLEMTVHEATAGGGVEGAGPVSSSRTLSWSTRRKSGEAFLLSGFLWTGQKETDADDSWLLSNFKALEESRGEVVLAISPRIVQAPDLAAVEIEMCVGTETRIGPCD